MKKAFFMLFLLIGSITVSIAQNVQEVVYLKNGSAVRGVVIEQVPGVSLKIQTSDGSIFAYQMSEVERITKETTKSNSSQSFNNRSNSETGYKGFIDLGYTIGIGDMSEDRLELSTSHGYQFNPFLYIGVGVAANYYLETEELGLPIFAHVRGSIKSNRISPFVDFRIGYSPLEDVKGLYLAPSIGCKIQTFSVSLGYVMQKLVPTWSDDDNSMNFGGLSLKVGFEF